MNLKHIAHIASVTTIFPQKRQAIQPVEFVVHESDAEALSSDFLKVGKDMQKAMEQYDRLPRLSHS
ncbi:MULTISPECIES: hypothetical protein [Halomonadaceae]|jgi:hypothetical protein|uniref:Uncharacterized protein n=1 Tax=Vreelandella aquamarina TaxID=77097 RepID=A0A0D7UVQ7_9GAMM|nr:MULTISPECIES: hypothetical protein [Halomonas]MBV65766.1 hypothetical protein [Halomonas sp.]KJD18705.1 hypothetical protein VE30_11585 [Halomonas meridiana]MCC4289340.1 hypothetical protein [Halomonas meridiana]MCC4291281.1 hypothetical protein [Halomonas axialensis]MCP1304152.1 hypothetical protein [Halomonas sp. R1t8]|tara:strand:+ start:368 stop:565 length:198 start_codon:yes stop_codon:yes gene_type:complete